MEAIDEVLREYNPAHPNYERWQKARELSNHRAEFVKYILSKQVLIEGLKILDIGAGEGSTSQLLSQQNFVVSLEPKIERAIKIQKTKSLYPVLGDCTKLPLKNLRFDLIILQDVIEHMNFSETTIDELKNLLESGGVIYLSTPNRLSIFNILSDPHWGMPFLCLFKRDQIKKYFLKYFRKSDYSRDDIAQLFSLKILIDYFEQDFVITLCTKNSVDYLFSGGKGIIWSKFHLMLLKIVDNIRLSEIIKKIANNKFTFINKYFTPTFYLILKKR